MRTIIFLFLTIFSFSIYAQEDIKSLEERILAFENCFIELSEPLPSLVEYKLNGGGEVNAIQRTDFAKQSFLQADPTIDKMSVNLYALDAADGFNFGETDITKIFDWAFDIGFAFNIFAHGVLDENGKSSGVQFDYRDLSPEELTEMIFAAFNDYDIIINTRGNPYPIILHSCSCAREGESSYAAKLSKIVAEKMPNAYIIAAEGPVEFTYKDGKYDEVVRKGAGTTNWSIFHDGKMTKGDKDITITADKVRGMPKLQN